MKYATMKIWLVVAALATTGMGFGCTRDTQIPAEDRLGLLETEPVQVVEPPSDEAQDAPIEAVKPTTKSAPQQPTVEVVDDTTLRYTFDRISFSAPKGWMVSDTEDGIKLTFADDTDGKASITIRLHDENVDLKKLVEGRYKQFDGLRWYEPAKAQRPGAQLWQHSMYAGIGGGGNTVWYEHGYGVEVSFFVNRLNSADLPLTQVINSLTFVEA